MDAKAFFDSLRADGVLLTVGNVDGLQRAIAYGAARGTQINSMAYYLATDYWETGGSCHPVEEGYYLGSPAKVKAFQRKLRYYPWFGRGLVQTTWERNYIAIAKAMGLPADTFTKNPDLLLEWQYALPAMFVGMETGLYTGKAVGDYIDDKDESDAEDRREYVNARRVVNGTDKAERIADLALKFERALKASGYTAAGPAGKPAKPAPVPPAPSPPDEAERPPVGSAGAGKGMEPLAIAFVVVALIVAIYLAARIFTG